MHFSKSAVFRFFGKGTKIRKYKNIFFVVFTEKAKKCTPIQEIKHVNVT